MASSEREIRAVLREALGDSDARAPHRRIAVRQEVTVSRDPSAAWLAAVVSVVAAVIAVVAAVVAVGRSAGG